MIYKNIILSYIRERLLIYMDFQSFPLGLFFQSSFTLTNTHFFINHNKKIKEILSTGLNLTVNPHLLSEIQREDYKFYVHWQKLLNMKHGK